MTFPGSLDDRDALRAVTLAGAQAVPLWHADADLQGVDAVVLPGGFSYGDYLRAGAIARFSPVVAALVEAARDGLPVLGICNGFQVLCEAGLLPGALTRNAGLRFVCRDQQLTVENTATFWTAGYAAGRDHRHPGQARRRPLRRRLRPPSPSWKPAVRSSSATRAAIPNGSLDDIAGVCSADGRVVGLMPHPEHAIEELTGPGSRRARHVHRRRAPRLVAA